MSTGTPMPGPITIKSQTVYHCNRLLSLAWITADRCKALASTQADRDGCESPVEEALSCILLAAAGAEAFINELGYELANHNELASTVTPTEVKQAAFYLRRLEEYNGQTLLKYEFAVTALTGKQPDIGAAPFQNLSALFTLRNCLMHAKEPSTLGISEDVPSTPTPNVIKRLITAKLTRRMPPDYRTHWSSHLMTERVAHWACKSAADACTFIAQQVPVKRIADSFIALAGKSSP